MEKNTLRIDTGGNPTLKDYFSRTKAGDECELTITFKLVETTQDGVTVGKIIGIDLPGDDEKEPEEVKPSGEEPVSMSMGGMPMPAYAATPEAIE